MPLCPGRAAALPPPPPPLLHFLLLLLLLPAPSPAAAGCAALGLCCPGRAPSCRSTGWRPDGSYGPCYCDQVCEHTLDCCHDYSQACPVECLEWLCRALQDHISCSEEARHPGAPEWRRDVSCPGGEGWLRGVLD